MFDIEKQQEELENKLNEQHEGAPFAFNKGLPKIIMKPAQAFVMDELPQAKIINVPVKSHSIKKPKTEEKPKTPDLF